MTYQTKKKIYIMKKNLTPTQKSIIKALEDEFTKINDVPTSTSGLIDIGSIIEYVDQESAFLKEIRLANNAFTNMKYNQMLADAESIKDDLDKLGLKVIHRNDKSGDGFYITSKKATFNEMGRYTYVYYINTHHIERSFKDVTRTVDSKYGVKFKRESYGKYYESFAIAVSSNEFKESLIYQYKDALGK